MIPDEAVEAVVRQLWDVNEHDDEWVDDFATYDDFLRHKARQVLEAAAPHLLAPVLKLAEQWEARGESDMAFSKTVQDEDIAIALLTDGAMMVENARHIRNAVAQAGVDAVLPDKVVEIGYVCRHGHFQFNDDPDGDSCGTKNVGRIYVQAEPEITPEELAEAIRYALESHHRKMEEWRADAV